MTNARRLQLLAAALLPALAACTTGQANTTPPIVPNPPPVNDSSVVLQMSVGTVNFDGIAAGLNVLETFRGNNGYTAIPITTASLQGPKGFRAPSGSKDPGSGQTSIPLGNAGNGFVLGTGISAPLSVFAAADGWGVGPPSCSCAGVNFYPFQPQFADATLLPLFPQGGEPFYGGPPAYPPTTLVASARSALVSIPSGWAEGFYFLGLDKPPPAGNYTFAASFVQNQLVTTIQTHAKLNSARLLPSLSGLTTVSSDRKGGLIVAMTLPHGVTQALVNVIDPAVPPASYPGVAPCTTGLGFATLLFTKSGTQRIPDDLGNYGQGGAPTFCKGDLLNVQIMGFDYDDFDLGPPNNAAQRPKLPVQADATFATTFASE
ncbi:MAG: hypothetical protein JO199_13945 [Candidatus Eremiobacteraeota bacterium]|nr:hypothetical protein [Candidatus Eremiobacteraeota bacterium]